MVKLVLTSQGILTIGLLLVLALAPHLPTSLVRWDALWYRSIEAHGYFFRPGGMSSTGFFPFFPWVWDITQLNAVGISIFNLALAGVAVWLLRRYLRLRPEALVLYAAFPSCMFLYLPYTEALFFFFSSLVLISVAHNFRPAGTLAAALFLGSLTRVTSFFYVPALAAVEVFGWLAQREGRLVPRLGRLVGLGLLPALGLLTVVLYQWWETGVWFAFNKTQQAGWDHRLRLPHLPLTSFGNGAVLLDGLALLVGVLAGGWLLYQLGRVGRGQGPAPRPEVIFAAVFVALSALHTTLFAPLTSTGQTSLLSLHRYVFCTPFFLILLNEFIPRQALSWQTVGLCLLPVVGLAALLGMLSTAPFIQRPPLLGVPVPGLLCGVLLLGYVALWLRAHSRWIQVVLYGSSLLLQFVYLYTYALGRWVG
ncbi:hypothetical protein [Hymenobacter metallicola]|nr:hypothetical protein [Hymenobacter metallicola]